MLKKQIVKKIKRGLKKRMMGHENHEFDLKGGSGEWGEVDQGGEFLENIDDA